MPLTFAHPAAILPFSRKSKYINFSAMVFGSMSPDFEYFLRGRPSGATGHSLEGFLTFNLPLVAIAYLIYHYFVHHTLHSHLPLFLQDSYTNKVRSSKGLKLVVFCYSTFFGMLTHIVWDSFTHLNGYVVRTFPEIFMQNYTIFSYSIPLYKFLQHGSTLLGLSILFGYVLYRSIFVKQKQFHTPTAQKWIFWSVISLLTWILFGIWYLIDYVSISMVGVAVVRVIDCFVISLLVVSVYMKYSKTSNNFTSDFQGT